ncbi:MAG: hypothetical protein H7Z74_09820 [Anaerolineae bacterium]|nr:hypothetical protein [Gemmatimonadaceae bacterium]
MKYQSLTILAAAAATLYGCATPQTETASGGIETSSRWMATISPVASSMAMDTALTKDTVMLTDSTMMKDTTMKHDMMTMGHAIAGSAIVTPASSSETSATVMISGATAGESYPWHVHTGTCGNDQGIVGPPASYTPITADASGKGEVAVTLPFSTPTTGSYMVNVHHMGKVVSCGQLSLSATR